MIRHVLGCACCCTVCILTRRPLNALTYVEKESLVQADSGAKFGLSLEEVSWLLAVKLVYV